MIFPITLRQWADTRWSRCRCCCRCGGRRCRRSSRRCKCSCGCGCRCGRGNVAVNESGALECGAGEVIEETGNISLSGYIELHGRGAYAVLARNQELATQRCEVERDILVDPRPLPKVIECYRLEVDAARGGAESAQSVRDDLDAFSTVVRDDI